MSMSLEELRALADAIRAEVAKAVVGQDDMIDQLLVALVSQGHVLLEGPPGTAKTFLANSFSTALGLDFGRIQFTPDLLPGDILGSNLFNFQTSQFTLTRGPIFCELLLDVVKGASTSLGASYFLEHFGASISGAGSPQPDLVRLGVAIACVFGNTASIFLGFKGGKGVATALGVFLGIYPFLTYPVAISTVLWLLVVGRTKYVSVGSIAAAATVPISFLGCAMYYGWDLGAHWPLLCLTVILAIVVLIRHRANIGRLRSGTESRIGRTASESSPGGGA